MSGPEPRQDDASPPSDLKPVGGEFADAALELVFARDQAGEALRHARLLLIGSAVLNSLFLLSDWRFADTPHFWVAITARLVVVALSLACLAALARWRSHRAVDLTMVIWMAAGALAIAALVSSHSTLALFVLIMLPSIYYLATPAPFRWTLACGTGCSAVLLIGFEWGHATSVHAYGLAMALVALNFALAMVVSRANRLRRLAWLAARAERMARHAAADAHSLLEQLFAASPVAIAVTDPRTGRILHHNPSLLALIGATEADLAGRSIRDLLARPGERERLLGMMRRNGGIDGAEVEIRGLDGVIRTVILRVNSLERPEGRLVISGLSDISARKAAEVALERLASTDMLTGLPNRLSFFNHAIAEVARAHRKQARLALLMIDLDEFKAINDRFGHQGGDEALRRFADTVRAGLARGQLAGRLGGEEFALLLPDTPVDRARAAAERLRVAVADIRLDGPWAALRMTTSIGVATIEPDESSIDAAIGRADAALYVAKRAGRNRVEVAPPPPAHPTPGCTRRAA